MSRVLRSGTRRDYKQLDEGQVEVLEEELFTDAEQEETEEESPKESDDIDGTASDEAADSLEVILSKDATEKVHKKDKLRRLENEIKQVEARIKQHRKSQSRNTKSMKDVEHEVNSLLDQQNKVTKKKKGKNRSSRQKKRYVVSSSSSSETSSSEESNSDSDSDSSSCSDSSGSHSKRKSRRRRSKKKSKNSGRKICRRSGKNRKISSNVKYPQQWPHSQLSLHYVSKKKTYEDLSIQEFCAGYATIIENTKSKREQKYRITHLKDLMYLSTKYRWDCVLSFHAACLLEIERGHIRWGDSFQSLQITTLAGGFIQSGVVSQRPNTRSQDGPISFCKNFQRGVCTEESDHMGELYGSARFLRHICARCWQLHKKKAAHPEDAEDCPSRE